MRAIIRAFKEAILKDPYAMGFVVLAVIMVVVHVWAAFHPDEYYRALERCLPNWLN